MTAALSSNASTPCAGTLCRGWRNPLGRAWECPALLPSPPTWPWSLTSPPFQAPYTTFLSPTIRFLPALGFHNNWGLTAFASWGKSTRHHPAMLRRCREKHQCIFADGQKASTVVHRNYSLQPGQSTGILGVQLVQGLRCWWWEPSCHSPLFLIPLSSSSPLPILWLFLPFFHMVSFSPKCETPERTFTSYFTFFPYCHSNYIA